MTGTRKHFSNSAALLLLQIYVPLYDCNALARFLSAFPMLLISPAMKTIYSDGLQILFVVYIKCCPPYVCPMYSPTISTETLSNFYVLNNNIVPNIQPSMTNI